MMYNFSNRAVSGFPVSIGTALALESVLEPVQSVYDPARVIPQKVDLSKYKYHYFNIKTLLRNIIGAVDNKNLAIQDIQGGYDTVMEEIEIITDLYNKYTDNSVKPVFYITNIKRTNRYKHLIKLRNISPNATPTHSFIEEIAHTVISHHRQEHFPFDIELFVDYVGRGSGTVGHMPSSLITTHLPYELLSYTGFSKLDLLESHTGKLKTKYDWYTKYHKLGKEDMSTLPFYERLLYFFGDNVMFAPHSITLRRQVLNLSRSKRWTPHTSELKIKDNLRTELRDIYDLIYKGH